MLPAQPNQSLIDGLGVLQALASSGRAVGSRELAKMLDLEPTRANRLLKTLAALGIAQQTPDRRYEPGPGMHVLSAQSLYGSGLIRKAMPHLADLHRLGYLVALGVLWRDQVCYLYHATPDMRPEMALGRAGLYPAERSGLGLVLLAQGEPLPSGELGKRLRRVREQGYARIQIRHGVSTLAVPLGNPAYAAIGLSGQISSQQTPRLVAELQQAVSRILGESS
jgi:DNA-binding IclR family transcriptional regulator